MKVILVVLILGFFINVTSAFMWNNHRPVNGQKTTPVSAQNSTVPHPHPQLQNGTHPVHQPVIASNKDNTNISLLQRVVNGQRYLVGNTTAAQRQADSIRKNGSQVIPQNRFQAIAYQHRALNTTSVYRQSNRTGNNTNKQMVQSRFRHIPPKNKTNATAINAANRRAFLHALFSNSDMVNSNANGSSIAKNKTQQSPHRLVPGKAAVTNTKNGLLQTLTTKAASNNGTLPQQASLADYYYQEKARALNRYLNQQNAAQNRALKKRETQLDGTQVDPVCPMILVRSEPDDTDQ